MSAWASHKKGTCGKACFYCEQKRNAGHSEVKWVKVNGGSAVGRQDKLLSKKSHSRKPIGFYGEKS